MFFGDDIPMLYPPRPTKAVQPVMLPSFDSGGRFAAQVKMNGTNNVITTKSGDLSFHNRHREPHKAWTPNAAKLAVFAAIKGNHVFVSELLHSKVTGIRDIIYIHEILVHDGKHLTGTTHDERQAILREMFRSEDRGDISHTVIDENTWLAKNYNRGFKALYDGLNKPEHEGVVLKSRELKLKLCLSETANNSGMLKSRKAHANYSF